jgi:tetratricopeptide (TPR) repeat protein
VLNRLSLLWHHMGDDETAREHAQQALRMARNQGDRSRQGSVLINLRHAFVGLGSLDEASDAYQQGLDLARELGQLHRAVEALTGLAGVSDAQGDLDQAQGYVEQILSYLETDTLDGTWEPVLVYLTCYRVLGANSDPRADAVLEERYRFLQERAAKISDEG